MSSRYKIGAASDSRPLSFPPCRAGHPNSIFPELSGLARSDGRVDNERMMRRWWLKRSRKGLNELEHQTLTRDALLMKVGAAKKEAGKGRGIVYLQLPSVDQPAIVETFRFMDC